MLKISVIFFFEAFFIFTVNGQTVGAYKVVVQRQSNVPLISYSQDSILDLSMNGAIFNYYGSLGVIFTIANKSLSMERHSLTSANLNLQNGIISINETFNLIQIKYPKDNEMIFDCGIYNPRIAFNDDIFHLYATLSDCNSESLIYTSTKTPFDGNSWSQSIYIYNANDQFTAASPIFANDKNNLTDDYIFGESGGFNDPGIHSLYRTKGDTDWTRSDDLLNIRHGYFDSFLMESGSPPVQLKSGEFFYTYNGVMPAEVYWANAYGIGYAILDANDPQIVLQRSDQPIMSPVLEWEAGNCSDPNFELVTYSCQYISLTGLIPHPDECDYANVSGLLGIEYVENAECFLGVYFASKFSVGVIQVIISKEPAPKPTSTTSYTKTTTIKTESMTFSSTEETTATTSLPEQKNKSSNTKLIIIIVSIVAGVIIIIFLLAAFFIYRFYVQKRRRNASIFQQQTNAFTNDKLQDKWETSWDKLLIKKIRLNSGKYSEILQGKWLESRSDVKKDTKVAVKTLRNDIGQEYKAAFLEEIEMTKKLNSHDRIIKMFGCITKGSHICLILELCVNFDLLKYVKKFKHKISKKTQTEFQIFAWQISQGMQYLASQRIIHRNLTASNILINENKNLKISDFGMCVETSSIAETCTIEGNTDSLPLKWMAIESLEFCRFSVHSDIWSFGMLLFEMYSLGETPLSDIPPSELLIHLKAEKRPQKPENCPNEIFNIMERTWNAEPSQRPTADEINAIFTELLEKSTEGYGYLYLNKAI